MFKFSKIITFIDFVPQQIHNINGAKKDINLRSLFLLQKIALRVIYINAFRSKYEIFFQMPFLSYITFICHWLKYLKTYLFKEHKFCFLNNIGLGIFTGSNEWMKGKLIPDQEMGLSPFSPNPFFTNSPSNFYLILFPKHPNLNF